MKGKRPRWEIGFFIKFSFSQFFNDDEDDDDHGDGKNNWYLVESVC